MKGETRSAVQRLFSEGCSVTEIAERLGVSKPTVCYHARKLGIPAKSKFSRRHDWESIAQAYESGLSMRACMRQFGFSSQAWYDAVKRGDLHPREWKIPLEELLVVGPRRGRRHLKARLIEAGLKENRCEICGVTEWRGKELTMQLHHENGDGLDNRLVNLSFLCPNCHSQTDTYGGRNGHRRKEHLKLVEPPQDEEEDVA